MYSETDIESAVAAGIMTPETAAAFRQHMAESREAPSVDEESFRLLTGFNDIFVTIALILLLTALAGVSSGPATGFLIAVVSWGLAEYFTRRRRMALPSILLLLTFVTSIFSGAMSVLAGSWNLGMLDDTSSRRMALDIAIAALSAAIGAYAHWSRFKVPITVAAGTAALVGIALALLLAAVPKAVEAVRWLVLLSGLGVFTFAMWWDVSDRTRTTRRSDVAFWLHLCAAPMIAHPIFWSLGVFSGSVGLGTALLVLVLYIMFACVALAIDRRAILVSSLAYVLYALYTLFKSVGVVDGQWALTGILIGSALLMLSALWQSARRIVVEQLPVTWQARLPALDRISHQPAS